MRSIAALFLFPLLFSAVSAAELEVVELPTGIVNKDVKCNIDLRTNMEEVSVEITVENKGTSPVSFYIFAIPPEKVSNLSLLHASQEKAELKSQRVLVTDPFAPKHCAFFRIQLPSALSPGMVATFQVFQVYIHTLIPFPAEILQNQPQLVEYFDNHFFFSPYPTTSVFTTVRLASERVETVSLNEKPSKQRKKDIIEYGPYHDKKPYSVSQLYVHFENNHPFVTFTKMVKEVEISHWGNVVVEEHYNLEHTGAALKGSFSRFEYQRNPIQWGRSSFRTIAAILPKYAHAVYYRDVIGNVSTSHLREERHHKILEVDPRFPMFGGWKTDFQIGYGLPAIRVLSVDTSNPTTHVLNISFSSPFSSAVVDKSTLRVILPEGASDIKYIVPFPMDDEGYEKRFTSLDSGRPVLVLRKKNLCRFHNQYIQVIYSFPQAAMIKEPLMLTAMFLGIFVIVMIYARIDLSLSTHNKRDELSKAENLPPSEPTDLSASALDDAKQHALGLLAKVKSSYMEKDVDGATKLCEQLTQSLVELKKLDSKFHDPLNRLKSSLGLMSKLGKALGANSSDPTKKKFLEHVSHIEETISKF